MFERFTADAIQALQFAEREALRLRRRRIETSHLFAGALQADAALRSRLASALDLDAPQLEDASSWRTLPESVERASAARYLPPEALLAHAGIRLDALAAAVGDTTNQLRWRESPPWTIEAKAALVATLAGAQEAGRVAVEPSDLGRASARWIVGLDVGNRRDASTAKILSALGAPGGEAESG